MKNLLIDFTSGIMNFALVAGLILTYFAVQEIDMTHEIFLVVQILGMCFISYLMGYMVGANRGHRDATKAWTEAYSKDKFNESQQTLFLIRPCGGQAT